MKNIVIPIDKEDLEVLQAKLNADVKCPNCSKVWHSPFPKTRQLCPKCLRKLAGYDYVD